MAGLMPVNNEAVMFFEDAEVDKEILYSEFEAILDGFINFEAYAGRELRAAFVQISPQLKIQGLVFFLIGFDADGKVLPNWNIPLHHLVDHAESGPDLGAGPVRMACRSSCPVEWYREQLWNPEMKGEHATFAVLKGALERNRLGLVRQKAEPAPKSAPEESLAPAPAPAPASAAAAPSAVVIDNSAEVLAAAQARYRKQLEALEREHELGLKTQADRLKRQLERLQADYTDRLNEQDRNYEALRAKLLKSRRKELALRELVDSHEQRFKKIQELYESSLRKGSEEHSSQLEVLRQQFESDLRQRLAAQAEELNERISMHEVELHYRDEQMGRLRQELAQLRRENQMLTQSEAGQILKRMTDSGITFVAYHPGIEHLVLAPAEITDYVKDPIAFVAERCGVAEDHYREWLMHYRLPVCRASDERGECCGQPVQKVLKPQFFRAGDSDRCDQHRRVPAVDAEVSQES